MEASQPEREPLIPPNLHRDWVLWASLALAIIPVARLGRFLHQPCQDLPPYFPNGDLVNYSELMAAYSGWECGLFFEILLAVPIASFLLLIFSTGKRFLSIPASVVAFWASITLVVLGFAYLIAPSTVLVEKDSIEFGHHSYHVIKGKDALGEMGEDQISRLVLLECDLNDEGCNATDLVWDHGWEDFETVFFEVNQDTNQLEVWADGEMIYAVSPDED